MPRSRFQASERAILDPLDVLAGDIPQRNQRDLMKPPARLHQGHRVRQEQTVADTLRVVLGRKFPTN